MKLSMFNKTKDIGISNDDCKWLILKLIPSTYHIHKYIIYLNVFGFGFDFIVNKNLIETKNIKFWYLIQTKKMFKLWFVPKLLVSSLEGTVGDSGAWHCDSRTSLTTSGRAGPRSPIHTAHTPGVTCDQVSILSVRVCTRKWSGKFSILILSRLRPPPTAASHWAEGGCGCRDCGPLYLWRERSRSRASGVISG